jgi:hypothetical protein
MWVNGVNGCVVDTTMPCRLRGGLKRVDEFGVPVEPFAAAVEVLVRVG